MHEDTIAAIATPPGSGAIAVIRVSGPETFEIVKKIFRSKSKKDLFKKGYTIHYGEIIDKNRVIDEVLISVFKAPHSYTGEDSVEISCHGSIYIQRKILELLIEHGARLAQPGEFTLRSFLNGKIDLSQAEAVADLIAAKSEAARKVAFSQLKGHFSDELKKLKQNLIDFVSLLELELDFAEEDVEFADRTKLKQLLSGLKTHIEKLKSSFQLGNAIKEGIPVAIVGEPNVGKSTLLNLLLREDKAIVSDIPGTTRDTIEDVISIQGILFRFIDTAGIRETSDLVENLGIEKAKEKIKKAEIIILILDAENPNSKIFSQLKELTSGKKLIVVVNKIDKIEKKPQIAIEADKIIYMSAKYGKNLKDLEDSLLEAINYTGFDENDIIISNERHYEALTRAYEALERAEQGLDEGLSQEFVAQDIREVLHYIGEITGEITTDDILGNIFKNFCIGK